MSIVSWLKAHRKQITIHTLVVAAFLLFLFSLAEPLFDRFERVAGESSLYEIALPAPTNNIQYWFDEIEVATHIVEVKGWAFIRGQDSLNSEIYIVLKSAHRTYIFDTIVMKRTDVTRAFKELNLNLDYSGFTALIPARKIANGEYTVGIYIKKGDIEALQYTSRTIEF